MAYPEYRHIGRTFILGVVVFFQVVVIYAQPVTYRLEIVYRQHRPD